jgi:protein required for attachment to host cells
MQKTRIEAGMWVVACDGRKWVIMENAGDFKFPNLRVRETDQQENPPTSQQGTDAPARSFASVGHARSAIEQTDWHDEAERKFLSDLAHRLDAAVGAGKVKDLIVVAAPRALGMIRKTYSERLKHAVRLEIDRDVIKMPVHEIEKLLSA